MVTLRDIASQASVSPTTVSKVLNGKYREIGITSDCAARVRAVADKMGYRVNRAARATASGCFNAIGLLKVRGSIGLGQLPDGLLNGVETQADKEGLQLTFSSIPASFAEGGRLPRILQESWADGFLLIGDRAPTEQFTALVRQKRVPLVSVGLREAADCVHPDDAAAVTLAVRRLLASGHQRVAHVPDELLPPSIRRERSDAFQAAMGAAGLVGQVVALPAERRRIEVRPWEERSQLRRAFLQSPDRPTAVVVDSVELAYPLLDEARSLGLRLPEDLAMITFHDVVASALGICIDTMLLKCGELGQCAVSLLQERIRTKEPLPPAKVKYIYAGGHTI